MKSILLADDSHFMRTYLKTILNEANYTEIIEAENGVQAINLFKIFIPEIVIMDITMPLLDGLDALKEILKMDPNAKVVMCSSLGEEKFIIKEALKIGAKEFVVKPYFHNLISIVEKLF